MVKVRVIPLGSAGLLVLGSQQAGCAAEHGDDAASDAESAYTQSAAGTGTLDLQYVYETSSGYAFLATNSVDEFVRVGERMTADMPASLLWAKLHPDQPLPDVRRLEKLGVQMKILHQRAGSTYKTTTLSIDSWTNEDQPDTLTAHTKPFTVGPKTDTLAFDLTIFDAADPNARVHIAPGEFLTVPVFGGDYPTKHAILDTLYAAMRQRVVESGKPVIGSDLVVTYTDWRANTLVDTYSIDREIGKAISYSRFGEIEVPIYGDLAFEVAYGVDFGDEAGFHEAPLPQTSTSRLLPPFGRTAFEAKLNVPENATKLSLYAHVRAILVVDYSKYSNVTERRYNQGDRILMREKWDNEGGVAGQNYELGVEPRQ